MFTYIEQIRARTDYSPDCSYCNGRGYLYEGYERLDDIPDDEENVTLELCLHCLTDEEGEELQRIAHEARAKGRLIDVV